MRKLMVAGLLLTSAAHAADPPVDARAEQLRDLRWGMFVCWSFSTFSGKEWTPGVTDVAFFHPSGVDTDQWARTAKEAGMGYLLFLTKHHDGFCLWDTQTTDRKVTKAPLGRDVLAEVRRSCDKYGIKLALYFSEGDWTWPGAVDGQGGKGGANPAQKKAQLQELCTRYGPVEFFWMDNAVGDGGLSHAETTAWVKSFQPDCLVGYNSGEPGDLRAGEMARPGDVGAPYRLGEFTYPILPAHDGGAQWFYSLPQHDALCRPAESLYRDYLGAVRHGNIFSLDVGPDYAGRLRDVDVATLRRVGEMIQHPPPPAARPLSEGKPATASSVWNAPGYEAEKAFDGDESTRWGGSPDARSGWLAVDLGAETRIGRVVVREIGFPRTEQFVIEVPDGVGWKAVAAGSTLGAEKVIEFEPVTTRKVRLNILRASEVPTIEEFEVWPPAG